MNTVRFCASWTHLHTDIIELNDLYFLILLNTYTVWLDIFQDKKLFFSYNWNFTWSFAWFIISQVTVLDNGPFFHLKELLQYSSQKIEHVANFYFHLIQTVMVKQNLDWNCSKAVYANVAGFLPSYRSIQSYTTGYSEL